VNISDTYLTAFNFLDRIFWSNEEYFDNLRVLLSSMDPSYIEELEKNNLHISRDKAMAIDWKEDLIDLYGDKNNYESIEVFTTLLQYLERYKDVFEIKNVIDFLNKMQKKPEQYKKYWQLWQESIYDLNDYKIDFSDSGGCDI
jgi:hypothetical protein